MKTFNCTFSDSILETSIEIESNKCKTLENLQNEISLKFNLTKEQFKIIGASEKTLKAMKKFNIQLDIKDKTPNVFFQFPNKQKILIENCVNMEYKDIISAFNKKGYYFSKICLINLSFSLFGIELPLDDNYFTCVPKDTCVDIQIQGKTVYLKYHNYHFYISDNETVKSALNLIKQPLEGCKSLSINNILHKKLDLNTKLKKNCNKNYEISAQQRFVFISSNFEFTQKLDFLGTVNEAKQLLSSIVPGEHTLNDILILDKKKKEVTKPETTLISIMDDDNKIFFKIKNAPAAGKSPKDSPKKIKTDPSQPKAPKPEKISINFIFEANPDFNFDKEISISTKIKEIKDEIAYIYSIESQIFVKCKISDSYSFLEDDKKIEDVYELIKEKGKDKKDHYVLYIETKEDRLDDSGNKAKKNPKKRVKRPGIRPIAKKPKQSEEEEEVDQNDILNKKIDPKNIKKMIEEEEENDQNDILNKKIDPKSIKKMIKEEEDSKETKKEKNPNINKKSQKIKVQIKAIEEDTEEDKGKKKETNEKSDKNPTKSQSKDKEKNEDDIFGQPIRKKQEKIHTDEDDDNKKEKIKTEGDKKDKKSPSEDKSFSYKFSYDGTIKRIELKDNSFLANNEDLIKEKFKIDDEYQLEFYIVNNNASKSGGDDNDDDDDELIEDPESKKMENFKKNTIRIDVIEDENAGDMISMTIRKTPHGDLTTYFYQISGDDEIQKAEFKSDAKVIDFKNLIKEKENVQRIKDIKILYAGKDLLDDVVLKTLKVGTDPLSVYIRYSEDLYLYTAKALHISVVKKTD